MAHTIVVGFGIAGRSAVRELLRLDPRATITVLAAEPFYPRHNLHHLIGGDLSEGELLDQPLRDPRLTVRIGVRPVSLGDRSVTLADGETLTFDSLIIATGSIANRPDLPGADLDGVVTLRTIDDARQIMRGDRVVIAGGGVLGLDALYGVHRRGATATLLVRDSYPGGPGLDAAAGAIVRERLDRLGLDVRYGAEVARLHGAGRVSEVELRSGDRLPADTVLFCVGTRPDLGWLAGSGLATNRGILVDDRLAASVPGIYAAGDCAEAPAGDGRRTGASWRTAEAQGRMAAQAISGSPVDPPRAFAITQGVYDLHYVSIGDPHLPDAEVDQAGETYRKVAVVDGRIHGALVMGDVSGVRDLEDLVSRRAAVHDARLLVEPMTEAVPPAVDAATLNAGDGRNGARSLVAVDGLVYDVSASGLWSVGRHMARHLAGRDLSAALREAPHDLGVLSRYPLVGKLAGGGRRLSWTLAGQTAAVAAAVAAIGFFVRFGLPH